MSRLAASALVLALMLCIAAYFLASDMPLFAMLSLFAGATNIFVRHVRPHDKERPGLLARSGLRVPQVVFIIALIAIGLVGAVENFQADGTKQGWWSVIGVALVLAGLLYALVRRRKVTPKEERGSGPSRQSGSDSRA